MGKTLHPSLGRLKSARVYFNGKYSEGERERLIAIIQAHGGATTEDLDAKVTHLVVPEGASTAAMQKKADSLRKKGATIEVMDARDFQESIRPVHDELVALLKDGKAGAKAIAIVASPVIHGKHGASKRCPRLVGASLDGADLSGFDLRGIAFEKCSFKKTKLDHTQIVEAIECDFSQATGASTEFGKINCSRFTKAKLDGASFCSHLHGSDFTEAKLDNSRFSDSFWASRVDEPPSTRGPCFAKARLRLSLFDGVWAEDADFHDADLTGAAFKLCHWKNGNFSNVSAHNALFVANRLGNSNFSDASLVGSNLAEADLTDANLDDADLTDANLRGTVIDAKKLRQLKGITPQSTAVGTIGAALTELDAIIGKSKKLEISFRVGINSDSDGHELQITAYSTFSSMRLPDVGNKIDPKPQGSVPFSQELLQAGRVFGHLPVRFETLTVKSTKSPKSGKALRDLIMQGIAEAFAQPLPTEEDSAGAAEFRKKQQEVAAAAREQREQAKAQAAKEKEKAKKQIAKKIEKAVGKVSDVASFLKALEVRIEKPKIDKATKMLKASGFKLFNDVTDLDVSGVVKSQTDPDLVYACRVMHDGQYSCCTQNLNVCGGLRGSICKHLLVLIIGLVQAGELDPTTIDAWIAKTHSVKPELDKEVMGAIFIKYKGAEAGEVDWRPTETVPEDYYTL